MECTSTKAALEVKSPSAFWRGALVKITWSALLIGLFYASPASAQNQSGEDGEKIYMENSCFVCHGQQGFGGIGPAFRNNPFLKLTDYVAGQIIIGRGVMPPFGNKLDDKQIAEVATYIRNSWGNQFGVVKPNDVAEARHELSAAGQQAGSPPANTTGIAPPTTGNPRRSR